MAQHGSLPGPEVEALTKRFLEGEPGVTVQRLKGGLGFLCAPPLGAPEADPWLFAVATAGGTLLRVDDETRERLVENGVGLPNAALPEWVVRMEDKEGHEQAAETDTTGDPTEWVWVPIEDSATFERRRPHIHEALSYCRHCLTTPRTERDR